MKSIRTWTERDISEENLIKDSNGKFIKFRRSEFTVRMKFDNMEMWTPTNNEIVEILRQICECEDKKYPAGPGRNMFFIKHVYPLFKPYLEKNGFKLQEREKTFVEGVCNENKEP